MLLGIDLSSKVTLLSVFITSAFIFLRVLCFGLLNFLCVTTVSLLKSPPFACISSYSVLNFIFMGKSVLEPHDLYCFPYFKISFPITPEVPVHLVLLVFSTCHIFLFFGLPSNFYAAANF